MILTFDKPKKLRSTKEHNDMHQSDSGVAGTYVPNMSQDDEERFKAKHINKGKIEERIEIRVSRGVNILIKVFKNRKRTKGDWRAKLDDHEDMQISMNGKLDITLDDWDKITDAVSEAERLLDGRLTIEDFI